MSEVPRHIMLKSSYFWGEVTARGNKFTSRGKLGPQVRTYPKMTTLYRMLT